MSWNLSASGHLPQSEAEKTAVFNAFDRFCQEARAAGVTSASLYCGNDTRTLADVPVGNNAAWGDDKQPDLNTEERPSVSSNENDAVGRNREA